MPLMFKRAGRGILGVRSPFSSRAKIKSQTTTSLELWPAALLGLLILQLTVNEGGAGQLQFQAVGEVKTTAYEAGTNSSFQSHFEVSVVGSNIYIKSIILGDEESESFEYRSDGRGSTMTMNSNTNHAPTNAMSFVDGKLQMTAIKGRQRILNDATVMVRTNLAPPYGFGFVTIIWLALGSKSQFPISGQSVGEPIISRSHQERESLPKIGAIWDVSASPPNCLERFAEYHDRNPDRSAQSSAPFQSAVTNVIFQTVEWTNVGEFRLPLRFELTRYRTSASGETVHSPTEIRSKLVGKITGYSLQRESFASVPPLPRRSRVLDFTVTNEATGGEYSVYLSPDGKLLDKNQLEKLNRTEAGFYVQLTRRIRLIVLFGLGITGLIFLAFNVIKRFRGSTK